MSGWGTGGRRPLLAAALATLAASAGCAAIDDGTAVSDGTSDGDGAPAGATDTEPPDATDDAAGPGINEKRVARLVHERVTEERTSRGLPPLDWDPPPVGIAVAGTGRICAVQNFC